MPVEFRCTQCNRLLRTQDETAGKKAKCPECGAILTIPAMGASPEATTPPAGPAPPLPTPPPPGAAPDSPFGPIEPPASGSTSPFAAAVPPPADLGESENPYASPQSMGTAYAESLYYPHPDVHAYAAARVAGPATALIVTGAIGLALQILGTAANLVGLAAPPNAQDAELLLFSGGVSVFFGILGAVLALVVIIGARKMKNLQSYGLAMTASIVAMIPCISPCCLLGLPFGIWALVVLVDPRVQAAFRS